MGISSIKLTGRTTLVADKFTTIIWMENVSFCPHLTVDLLLLYSHILSLNKKMIIKVTPATCSLIGILYSEECRMWVIWGFFDPYIWVRCKSTFIDQSLQNILIVEMRGHSIFTHLHFNCKLLVQEFPQKGYTSMPKLLEIFSTSLTSHGKSH